VPYKGAVAVAPTVGGAPLTRSQLQHPRATPSELMIQFKEAARAKFHGAANEDDLVRLYTEHVYQASTTANQATHWNNFLRFLREIESTLPASDVVVAGWIAWLTRQHGRPSPAVTLSAESLKVYVSGARQVACRLGLYFPPAGNDLIRSFLGGYKKAINDSAQAPRLQRVGLSASSLQLAVRLAMSPATTVTTVGYCARIVLAMMFGLRESSVLAVLQDDIRSLSDEECTLFVRRLKGRSQDEAITAGARTFRRPAGGEDLPFLVLRKWKELRPRRLCWLDVGYSDFGPQCTTRSMRLILDQLGIHAPDGCAYSSHSARIGSLSEHLHVATNMASPFQWYDWRMGSSDMILTYADRCVQRSEASGCIFRPGLFKFPAEMLSVLGPRLRFCVSRRGCWVFVMYWRSHCR
jgi:hypothetical protein